MALHGNFELNGKAIGQWSAVREAPVGVKHGWYWYACDVTMYGPPAQRHTFQVQHRFADGAVTLAGKVMRESVMYRAPLDES